MFIEFTFYNINTINLVLHFTITMVESNSDKFLFVKFCLLFTLMSLNIIQFNCSKLNNTVNYLYKDETYQTQDDVNY